MRLYDAKNKLLGDNSDRCVNRIKIDNHSMKVMKNNNDQFLIMIKEHFLGIPISKHVNFVDSCESAEDCIGYLKCEYFKITDFRDIVRKIFNGTNNK